MKQANGGSMWWSSSTYRAPRDRSGSDYLKRRRKPSKTEVLEKNAKAVTPVESDGTRSKSTFTHADA
jgi:hypothetical protein